MAKINTLTVDGSKQKGFTVTAMLDDGSIVDIKEGFEFCPMDIFNDTKDLYEGAAERVDDLLVEIGQLQQQLAAKPAEVRAPLLHVEHQNIPTSRTVDKLAPLDALAPAPALPDPQYRLELDPDAPARPPALGEVQAHRGEYQGTTRAKEDGFGTGYDNDGRPTDEI